MYLSLSASYINNINISISVGTTSRTACRAFLDLRTSLSTNTYFTGSEDCEEGGREEAAQPRAAQEAVVQDQGEVVRGAAGQEEAEAGQDTPGHHHA